MSHVFTHVETSGVGGHVYTDVGFVLGLARDPERLRGPDASFVSLETIRKHGGEPTRGWFRGVPDLAIEIDSPGRKPIIERQRIQDYMDAGVRMLWVIHTRTRNATVYQQGSRPRLIREDEALNGGSIIPALRLPLRMLFAELPED